MNFPGIAFGLACSLFIPLQAQVGTSLFPPDPTPSFRLQGIGPENWTVTDVQGQPFSRAWRLKTPYAPGTGNPYDFFLVGHALQRMQQGDLLLATVWIRSISAVYGQAHTRFVVQEDQPPYKKSAEWYLSAGSEWKRFQIPFRAVQSNSADTYSVQFWIGSGPQEIEIGGLQVLNYGPGVQVKDLALSGYPYEGFQAKAWLPEAEKRIEKLRKGSAVLVIRDDNGVPMPRAKVEIRMKSHQFGFGTAVELSSLTATDAATDAYRRTFLANFNRATPENDLKWQDWLNNRDMTLRGLDWLKANGIRQVRGHTLVWPSFQYLPGYLQSFANNPSGLDAEIARHIRDETAATAGRVSEWDVLNEPVTNTALQKILGDAAMAKWFKIARENEPTAKLYVNDYNLLEGGGYDTPHQAGLDAVIKSLDANGAGLQGIGLQAHMQWQLTDPLRLYEVLSRYGAYGRDLQITELDVDVEDPELQAEYLTDMLTLSFSHPALSGVTLWGFWEGRHFRPNAALWSRNWTIKPAGQAWRDLIYKKWWTQLSAETDADGMIRFSGFGGQYEAVVTINGRQQVLNFELLAGQSNYLFLGKSPSPKLTAAAALNGASFAAGAVSPGEIVALFGTDFGHTELASAQFDSDGSLPSTVGDVSVVIDGKPAQMLYSVLGQAGAVLPLSIRGVAKLQIGFLGLTSNEIFLPVADASPGIFTESGGTGQAVVVNASTGQMNSGAGPAARGEIVTFFATGMGVPDASGAPPGQTRVLVGDREAELQFAGLILPGVFQFNAKLAANTPVGGAVALSVGIGNFKSQAGVTIAVR